MKKFLSVLIALSMAAAAAFQAAATGSIEDLNPEQPVNPTEAPVPTAVPTAAPAESPTYKPYTTSAPEATETPEEIEKAQEEARKAEAEEEAKVPTTATESVNNGAFKVAEGEPKNNIPEVLNQLELVVSGSVSDQYKTTDKEGNLVDTPLSIMADDSEATRTEQNTNGEEIPEKIQDVEQMLTAFMDNAGIKEPDRKLPTQEENGFTLEDLDQLTYMMDLKDTSQNRVASGKDYEITSGLLTLDDGTFTVTLPGNEITRSIGDSGENGISDIIIAQIDPKTNEIYYLSIDEYDPKTGNYTVTFPCIGPFIICQNMHRSDANANEENAAE